MKFVWDVDRQTEITLRTGFLRPKIFMGGQQLRGRVKLHHKRPLEFKLLDGRSASLLMPKPFLSTRPTAELRVEGELMNLTTKTPVQCRACAAKMMPNDKFCDSCGLAAPSAEVVWHRQTTQRATKSIVWLALLFLVWAVAGFGITESKVAPVLRNLAPHAANEHLKPTSSGKVYTVGEARAELQAEPYRVMAVNLILAAIMGALAVWARRAPVAPLIVALAVFIAVHTLNALIDPATLAQGFILKAIIIVYLASGIRSALALRAANAEAV